MAKKQTHAVTGAFGYSGKYIAKRLLAAGREVITLTNSPQRANPFGGKVKAYPFNFQRPEALAESLRGVKVLYNVEHQHAVKHIIRERVFFCFGLDQGHHAIGFCVVLTQDLL